MTGYDLRIVNIQKFHFLHSKKKFEIQAASLQGRLSIFHGSSLMQISSLTHIEQLSRQKFSEEKIISIFLTSIFWFSSPPDFFQPVQKRLLM